MVQLSRLGPPLALAAATLLLLGGGAARVASSTAAAGVAGTTAGVQVIGGPRTGGIERVVDVLTHDLGLPLPAGTRVHVYTTREAFRRGLVQDAAMGEEGANELAAFAIGIARPGRALLNRRLALVRVQRQPAFAHGRLDLSTLGSPRDFTLRHQREGSVETYHLTFLLADYLIERHGLAKMVEYFGRLKRHSAFGYSIAVFETQALAHLQAVTSARD